MNQEKYLQDITEIKNMMNRSSKFISLSGWSGIMAGIYALIGAYLGYNTISNLGYFSSGYSRQSVVFDGQALTSVLSILAGILILSVGTAIFLTTKKAKKNNAQIWDATTKRLLINFLVPLVTGGIYILIILSQGKYGQSAGLMLLFYGLSLINASKYTYSDIKVLGYLEIALGLLAAFFVGYGFWFWVLGFGILHIIYGTIMYFKYDKNNRP